MHVRKLKGIFRKGHHNDCEGGCKWMFNCRKVLRWPVGHETHFSGYTDYGNLLWLVSLSIVLARPGEVIGVL